MKFQVIHPFTTRDPNTGRTVSYRLGQRIGETAYRRLSERIQQTYFLSARAAAGKVPYLRSEVQQLVNLYLELNGDTLAVRSAFLEANPDTRHSAESLRAAAGQIRALDSHCPNDTDWVAKSLFREVAAATDPERFSGDVGVALDSLLSRIRSEV